MSPETSPDDSTATRWTGADAPVDPVAERLRSPERVTALSDGVFAIVITILVLEIKVPAHLPTSSLREAFHELRPTLVAWIISFLITGMYWVAHRDIFARVRAVNRDLVWLNLLFLLTTALIPFAASVLGEYPDARIAIQLYGVVVTLTSLLRLALYAYVIRHPDLMVTQAPRHRTRQGFFLAALPIVLYLVAIGFAWVSTTASALLLFSVPVIYFLAVTFARDRGDATSEAEDFS